MKSGLLAHVNMGNMSLWLCRGRLGGYSRQWLCSCACLRLCRCLLKPKLQCYQCKVYFTIYIWPFQQDSISRLKMSWEDIKWFLKWITESAIHILSAPAFELSKFTTGNGSSAGGESVALYSGSTSPELTSKPNKTKIHVNRLLFKKYLWEPGIKVIPGRNGLAVPREHDEL